MPTLTCRTAYSAQPRQRPRHTYTRKFPNNLTSLLLLLAQYKHQHCARPSCVPAVAAVAQVAAAHREAAQEAARREAALGEAAPAATSLLANGQARGNAQSTLTLLAWLPHAHLQHSSNVLARQSAALGTFSARLPHLRATRTPEQGLASRSTRLCCESPQGVASAELAALLLRNSWRGVPRTVQRCAHPRAPLLVGIGVFCQPVCQR